MKNQVKENIVLIICILVAASSVFMFWLGWDMGEKSYQIKDSTLYSEEDLTGSYNVGFEDGLHEAEEASMTNHTEIVESWFCNLESVTINNEVVHIIDGNGEEWVITTE